MARGGRCASCHGCSADVCRADKPGKQDGMASLSSPSLLLNGGLTPLRWLSLQRSGCCLSSSEYHFPQTNSRLVSVTPLFTYPTQPVETGRRSTVGNFVPTYRSDITAWAFIAAGLRSSASVVRVPGLRVDAPASLVVTLVSLEAGRHELPRV